MKVVEINGAEGVVASGGLRRKGNFSLLKDVRPGDYVLLHAGFAIAKVKPEEARKTIRMIEELKRE
jgi:hydrogenase expression/formation protein HypC